MTGNGGILAQFCPNQESYRRVPRHWIMAIVVVLDDFILGMKALDAGPRCHRGCWRSFDVRYFPEPHESAKRVTLPSICP